MWRALPRRWPGWPMGAWSRCRSGCACGPRRRLCSVTFMPMRCSLTGICPRYTISGVLWCDGRRPPVPSCVPGSSYGRRATPPTPPPRTRRTGRSRCWTFTLTSVRRCWRSRWSAGRRRIRRNLRGRRLPIRSRPWCMTARPSSPAPAITSATALPRPSASSSPIRIMC